MRKLSESRKMYYSVMTVFAIYAVIFILFEDYDQHYLSPFKESSDWHLLSFSVVVMALLGGLLHHYSRRMDERISREQADKENKMRRELTQNISHELKTPVTSILGYTETILEHPDLDVETRLQFIKRTQSQAQRLAALLQDISTLNRMDYANDIIAMEQVNVSTIVEEIVQETSLAASRRRMTINNLLPLDIVIEKGNSSLIYSIFRNLMDNAINYAGEGTSITIVASDAGKLWQFTFADNGKGIDNKHLPRIFERFYRIDKGRSRELGGTGLGLAIVKNAVVLHGGTIQAHPSQGGGLCFDFTLKK